LTTSSPAVAASAVGSVLPGVSTEFVLFALTLAGVALLHRHTLRVALAGLTAITLFKLTHGGFRAGVGFAGLAGHIAAEWVPLANLLALLLGFALLAKHFERSGVPGALPRYLPGGWRGPFALLVIIFVLSSFLDNIAAALIGGTMARTVFRARVHVGYLAGIVAASNAGGAGSVVGDTTTTMMWINGVGPGAVAHAYIASVAALVVFGIPASRQQHNYSALLKSADVPQDIDWVRVGIVAWILVAAIGTNIIVNTQFPDQADAWPYIGGAIGIAVLTSGLVRRPDWGAVPGAFKGALFLLSLVLCASLMPVERLPAASWPTALGLGFVSAVFDNIPLTALALKQGAYDWGFVAYAVGFGGSMLWFGSSAGVALTNMYPESRSTGRWLRGAWHVAVAYVVGFFALLWLSGWQPDAPHRHLGPPVAASATRG
jgi:Na+/H+ antiporter NhaD/arsenite permease-like protein